MKTFVMAAAAVSALVATPALAGTLQGEVRFGDVRGGRAPDSTEYRAQWDAPLNSFLNYGVELQVKQGNNEGPLGSKVSAKLGPALPEVLGFHPTAYGEFGRSLSQGDNYEFWGAGVKVSRQVVGPVSVNVGYRHREGFGSASNRMAENRLNGGLAYDIGSGNSVGVSYYRTTGSTRTDQVGVGLTHSF